jgi:NAD+ synthase (glutamine-hydrolysing)
VVRIALGQLNTTVGDLDGNVARMADWTARATNEGADVVLFPELAITGYPPEDLVLRPEFVEDNLAALQRLAKETAAGCDVIVGFVDRSEAGLHNAAALLRDGTIAARYAKNKLPNYGVFDEKRYFVPGTSSTRVTIGGSDVGLSVCEDAWLPGPPFDAYGGVSFIANINGSPFDVGKAHDRTHVLRDRAHETGAWIVYVNAVGGQDELVFDGGSLVMAPDGTITCWGARFDEDLVVITLEDVASHAEARATWPDGPEEVYRALQLGLGDYVRKNGFRDVTLGLSGGIDSALVAALAADALGADRVEAVSMPTRYNSEGTRSDARVVAERLGIAFREVAIEDLRLSLEGALPGTSGLAAENLQARIRGVLLMTLSNQNGWLVLTTGNKSETAVGYSTLYGDSAGGFAPIKDVPKTLVFALARYINEQAGGELIPASIIERPPSAELRDDQRDDQSLPPYEQLDPMIEAYVEDDLSPEEIARRGLATLEVARRVARLVDLAEYKRRQAPPGIKVHTKAFGRDRRLPITNRFGR